MARPDVVTFELKVRASDFCRLADSIAMIERVMNELFEDYHRPSHPDTLGSALAKLKSLQSDLQYVDGDKTQPMAGV